MAANWRAVPKGCLCFAKAAQRRESGSTAIVQLISEGKTRRSQASPSVGITAIATNVVPMPPLPDPSPPLKGAQGAVSVPFNVPPSAF